MTCPVIKKVTCPNCGTEGDFIIYSTINVTFHPELQKKMDICNYPFIDHDMERGVMQCLSMNTTEAKLKELGVNGIIELD